MRADKRRTIARIPSNTRPEGLAMAINNMIGDVEKQLSQTDAVGQNPDIRGRKLLNVGNLKEVAEVDTGTPPSTTELADKLNEILRAFNGG